MEKLTYTPHPSDRNATLLKQEAVVTVQGVPLSSYIEDFISSTISTNANKGRLAMEWVIGKIDKEMKEIKQQTVQTVDEITTRTKKLSFNSESDFLS